MSLTHWLSEGLRLSSRTPRPASNWRGRPARSTFRPGLECLEGRWVPSTLPVTSALDDATQRGTLRYAVAHAQSGDTILLTPAIHGAGITLTQGELLLSQQGLTIKSAGSAPVTISGGNLSRVFEVASGASVTLSNVTVTGGNAQTGNPYDAHEGRGGGIVVDEGAALTMTGSTVTNNSAPVIASTGKGGLGGGIADYGMLMVNNSAVTDNHALATYGGGIAVFSGAPFSALFSATLTVSDSTVADNTAFQNGGGIAGVSSTVTLTNCRVTGNSTYQFDGAGLNNHEGTMTVSHSVVSNNTANGVGGGIQNYIGSTLTVTDSDVSMNSARYAGGVDNSGTLTIRGSRLSQNSTQMYGVGGAIFNENSGSLAMTTDFLTENSADSGGGVLSVGDLTMSGCTLSNNSARNSGGAIISYGTLAVNRSIFSGNSAYYGGAVLNGGMATISDSKLDNNSAIGGQGGGIINFGMLTITGGEINNNTSDWGGGIDNEEGTITLSNCLLSGNSAAQYGGAIFNYDTVTIDNCTLSNNTAGEDGGGIANFWVLAVSNCTFIANTPQSILDFGFFVDGGGNTFI
jgi:hypothetical protein